MASARFRLLKLAALADMTPEQRAARIAEAKAKKAARAAGQGEVVGKGAPVASAQNRGAEAVQDFAQSQAKPTPAPAAAADAAADAAKPAAQAADVAKPAAQAADTAADAAKPAAQAVDTAADAAKGFRRHLTGKNLALAGLGTAALGGAYLLGQRKQASIAEYSVLFDKVASGELGEGARQALYGVCQAIEAPIAAEKSASVYDASNLSEEDARKARLDQLLKR